AGVGGDAEPVVVAVVGDVGPHVLHRIDHVDARLGHQLLAVDGDGDEPRVLGRRLGDGHCSTSPPIMLMVSKVGIRSASIFPSIIRGTPERMANPGARTWTLYGRPDPSLPSPPPDPPFP